MRGQNETIIRSEYSEVMQKSYIDYAMSVIVSRAIPDVRDGLKPVQRRTLYDMHELGIRYDRPYRKCARIVGDTMGKYHPHGDSSIYDALVVMAQDFKKGAVLVDGHGNFGSIEGDGAAAMRYTEARLSKLSQEVFLADLDKNLVDFMPNFDETEKEPVVLPVRIPNLLVNGSEGIAVGMTTSTPTHNLAEVTDAVRAYMKNNNITTKGLMKHLPGPDFPTGGVIVNQDDLMEIYETGSGKLKIRGKVELEKGKNGHDKLVITEIPYTMIGAGITKFLNDVAALVESKKASDIIDISNQSSKEGIRIVLELKKGADAEYLEKLLYKKTKLEDTFGVNMLAVVDGRPETLGLKKIIEHHVDFQFELCTKKYQTLLKKEQDKREIQEGLIKACDVIDLIIEILRGSRNVQDAKACLTSGITENIKFKSTISKKMAALLRFTDRQAQAILDMRLYKLIGLEIEALRAEHEETLQKIARYEDILNNYDSMSAVIMEDLKAIKKEYGRPRRTTLENAEEIVIEEKKIEEQEIICLIDRFGYARTVDVSVYERNKEVANAENAHIVSCLNTGRLCIFTDTGRMHTLKLTDLPYGKFRNKGLPIDNVSNFDSQTERIVYICDMEQLRVGKLLFLTRSGFTKQVEGEEFQVGKKTISATNLNSDDAVLLVDVADSDQQILLRSHNGYYLRFRVEEIPLKKKTAVGVRSMQLAENDYLEEAHLCDPRSGQNVVLDGKEISPTRINLGKRDGKGNKVRLG